ISKIESVLAHMKEIERENESFQAKLSNQETANLLTKVDEIDGIKVIAEKVSVKDMNQLCNMVEQLNEKLESGVILLAAENNGKVLLISGVSKDLVLKKLHAGKLINKAAKICGGGGGGRPDMAQAGGKDASKIPEALKTVYHYIEDHVKN